MANHNKNKGQQPQQPQQGQPQQQAQNAAPTAGQAAQGQQAQAQQQAQNAANQPAGQAGNQMTQILNTLQQMQQNQVQQVHPGWWTRTRAVMAAVVAFITISLSAVSLGLWAENIRIVSYQSGYTAGQKVGYAQGREYMSLKYAATPWWRRWWSGITGDFPE